MHMERGSTVPALGRRGDLSAVCGRGPLWLPGTGSPGSGPDSVFAQQGPARGVGPRFWREKNVRQKHVFYTSSTSLNILTQVLFSVKTTFFNGKDLENFGLWTFGPKVHFGRGSSSPPKGGMGEISIASGSAPLTSKLFAPMSALKLRLRSVGPGEEGRTFWNVCPYVHI